MRFEEKKKDTHTSYSAENSDAHRSSSQITPRAERHTARFTETRRRSQKEQLLGTPAFIGMQSVSTYQNSRQGELTRAGTGKKNNC